MEISFRFAVIGRRWREGGQSVWLPRRRDAMVAIGVAATRTGTRTHTYSSERDRCGPRKDGACHLALPLRVPLLAFVLTLLAAYLTCVNQRRHQICAHQHNIASRLHRER